MLRGLFWLLLILLYVRIAAQIITAPLDFDEGYNLQVSYHTHEQFLNYATFNAIFDPNITTGAPVLLPAAIFINKNASLLPRITMFLYTIFFIYLCLHYILISRIQKVAFVITLLITPLFIVFSSHVLGELPGFFFLLLSFILLDRKKFIISGIAFACSILTKQTYLFGIIPLLWLLFNNTTASNAAIAIQPRQIRKSQYRKVASSQSRKSILIPLPQTTFIWSWLKGFLSIIAIWLFYIYSAVQFSWIELIRVLDAYERTTKTLSEPKTYLFMQRFDMFGYVFSLPSIVILTLFLGISLIVFLKQKKSSPIIASIALYTFIHTVFFLIFGSTNWYRHLFPAVLGFSIVLPIFITSLLLSSNEKYTLALGAIGVIVLINTLVYKATTDTSVIQMKKEIEQNFIFSLEQPFLPRIDPTLKAQLRVSEYIEDQLDPSSIISGIGWWHAPEIAYVARRPIGRDPFREDVTYIITDYYGDTLGQYDYKLLQEIPKRLIYKTDGYSLYQKL